MPQIAAKAISQILLERVGTDADTTAHQVLECLRRFHLAYETIGSDSVNLRIAAVLIPGEGEFYSTTVLLNETGLSRTTLLRRMASYVSRGLAVQTTRDGQTCYRVTSPGAQLGRDLIREAILVITGQRIGFSQELQKRLRDFGFQVKPSARTLAFSSPPSLSKTDTQRIDQTVKPRKSGPRVERQLAGNQREAEG